MALPKIISRLYQQLSLTNRSKSSGFTLLELLVAMIISSIVISGLLYLVVELLKTDRRESVLDQTQRDMQRAMDYISDDIREAVFLYENPSIMSTASTHLTDLPLGAVPILAFWRPDPINTAAQLPTCSAYPSTTTTFQECEVLRIRQATYSLVVYLQTPRDSNANWPGESRIIRYELDKYSNSATLASTPGYRDPTSEGVSFDTWTRSGSSTLGQKSVLVDFVDDPTTPLTRTRPCQTLDPTSTATYATVPRAASTSNTIHTSFFGCIRSSAANAGGNQDAYLYLRGSTDGAGGALGPLGRESSLPTLETRVLMRGVINKNPAN
ncbi:MAG: hypothetical protein DCF15_02875 [Phormidesmis priestleyi]|uniref:Prepilin-type cleavage/methylation domain-containing protein n=1 Tax=Phormidesmis priestleyi TaxID=268141 RepID=A0A2W4XSP5_9CYAN|nr:MAG: hypothetical protein DCF15_02875 [Phormidesmis priestleyi]